MSAAADGLDEEPVGYLFRRSLLCRECGSARSLVPTERGADSLVRLILRETLHPDVRLVCDHCKAWIGGGDPPPPPPPCALPVEARGPGAVMLQVGDTMATAKRKLFEATLRHHGGHRKRTAEALGVSVRAVYAWLRGGCE